MASKQDLARDSLTVHMMVQNLVSKMDSRMEALQELLMVTLKVLNSAVKKAYSSAITTVLKKVTRLDCLSVQNLVVMMACQKVTVQEQSMVNLKAQMQVALKASNSALEKAYSQATTTVLLMKLVSLSVHNLVTVMDFQISLEPLKGKMQALLKA